ncbi:hypothetical protein [Halanaerobaculum tunisiense]
MTAKDFSLTEAFDVGWQILKNNFTLFFLPTFLWFSLLQLGRSFGFKGEVIFNLLRVLVTYGVINLIFKLYDEQEAEFKDFIFDFDTLIKLFMFLLSFLVLLGVVVMPIVVLNMALNLHPELVLSILLVVILGGLAYLNTKFLFASYLLLDKEIELFAAFKKSFALTRGVSIKIFFLLFLVVALITVSLVHPFLIPLIFVTYPSSLGACVSAYRQLEEKANF